VSPEYAAAVANAKAVTEVEAEVTRLRGELDAGKARGVSLEVRLVATDALKSAAGSVAGAGAAGAAGAGAGTAGAGAAVSAAGAAAAGAGAVDASVAAPDSDSGVGTAATGYTAAAAAVRVEGLEQELAVTSGRLSAALSAADQAATAMVFAQRGREAALMGSDPEVRGLHSSTFRLNLSAVCGTMGV